MVKCTLKSHSTPVDATRSNGQYIIASTRRGKEITGIRQISQQLRDLVSNLLEGIDFVLFTGQIARKPV